MWCGRTPANHRHSRARGNPHGPGNGVQREPPNPTRFNPPPPEANHSPSFRRGLGGGPFPFAQRRGLGANRTQGMLATPSQTQRPPSLVFPNEPPLRHLVILNGAKRSEESPRHHRTPPHPPFPFKRHFHPKSEISQTSQASPNTNLSPHPVQ